MNNEEEMESDDAMEAKTPKEFFSEILPKKFNPDKAEGVDVIVQVNIAGPNGGTWTVTIKDRKIAANEGTHQSPTITISMIEEDYMNIVNGKMTAEKAFFSGKIQVKGNIRLALKLRDIGFL